MLAEYPTVYRDRRGEVATTITNYGKWLRMLVRDIELVGDSFDWFELSTSKDKALQAGLSFDGNQLCSYALDCDIPMPVVYGGETLPGKLHMHFELGDPRPDLKRGLDREMVQLTLTVAGQSFTSGKTESGWFEDELVGIRAALPEGMYMKCCFTCAFSDYFPAGFGLFGELACFRDNKEAYRQVWSKYQLFEIWDTRTDFVQETFLCLEFERREPGAGYRG